MDYGRKRRTIINYLYCGTFCEIIQKKGDAAYIADAVAEIFIGEEQFDDALDFFFSTLQEPLEVRMNGGRTEIVIFQSGEKEQSAKAGTAERKKGKQKFRFPDFSEADRG